MASVVEICNSAILKIGGTRITALTDDSREAAVCNEQFGKIRDAELRKHTWNFAIKRKKLARLADAPAFGWTYQYQLPSDFIRVIALYDNDDGLGALDCRIEGKMVLADVTDVWLRYVARVEDPNEFDVLFAEALAFRMAQELAVPIAGSNSLLQAMESGYRQAVTQARSVDSIEDFPDTMPIASWASARHRTA